MKDKSVEKAIFEVTGDNHPISVKLNDEINIGCNHCGNCCINSLAKLNAFDLYNISKKIKDEKKVIESVDIYFGLNSGLPVVSTKTRLNDTCVFLKVKNGDFHCILPDEYLPSECKHPFIAIGIVYPGEMLNFVPFDEDIENIDIDAYLDAISIDKNSLYFMQEKVDDICKCNNKKPVKVSEYLKYNIKYQEENGLALLLPLLLHRYINPKRFFRLLHLADNSSCNNVIKDFGNIKNKKDMYNTISRKLLSVMYFYYDIDDDDFKTQTINQINKVQNKMYPLLRVLYKYFYEMFDPSYVTLDAILDTEDEKLAQERFDNYFKNNKDIIMERSIPVLLKMIDESKKAIKED